MAAAVGRARAAGITRDGVRRSVPGGRAPLPRGQPARLRHRAAVPDLGDADRRAVGAHAGRRAARAADVRRPAAAGRALRRARLRRRAARRAAAVRRPVRRERRVPHLRLRRPDVHAPGGAARGRGGHARRLRVRGSDARSARATGQPHRLAARERDRAGVRAGPGRQAGRRARTSAISPNG